VYVLGIPNFIVFCALLPRVAGARVVLDMRDPFPEFYLSKYGATGRSQPPWWLLMEERLSARFASRVLTAHASMARLYERSVDAHRMTVVLNAPDPRLLQTPHVQRDPSDRTLLYTGTITYPYGIDLAVRAVARLHGAIPDLRLRLVGHGEMVDEIEQLARDEGVADRVDIEPFVPADRVAEIVRSSWVGVQPGRNLPIMRTSLSTKILEWCLLRLPVVAGRTPPLAETFVRDELLLHELGDLDGLCECIWQAHEDPCELARRAERALRVAAKFSYDDQIRAFMAATGTHD
jgi:glycosyltransferase involved in cell wall biosynthesis